MVTVVVNRVNQAPLSNEVIYLEDLKRAQILEVLTKLSYYRDTYILAITEDLQLERSNQELYTLSEYLEAFQVTPDSTQLGRIIRLVASRYREKYNKPPVQVTRKSRRSKKWSGRASGYPIADLDMIKEIVELTMGIKISLEDLDLALTHNASSVFLENAP